MPLLSIIIPVYNTEKYIRRCLDSLVNQSLKDVEILVICDQCTDSSVTIVEEYIKQHDNIYLFLTERRCHVGGTRNIGILNAKGKYIGFVDSDDWVDLSMYEKVINQMTISAAEIGLAGVAKEQDSPYDVFYKYVYQQKNLISGKYALELLCKHYNQDISISPIVCNKVFSSDFLKTTELRFIENNYNDDDVFTYLCFWRASKVSITPDVYYHYYQRHDSIIHTFSKKYIDDFLFAFKFIKSELERQEEFIKSRIGFYSYLERCLSVILNLLITKVENKDEQNIYLLYLLEKARQLFPIDDYIEYCGASRLRYFLNPLPIK